MNTFGDAQRVPALVDYLKIENRMTRGGGAKTVSCHACSLYEFILNADYRTGNQWLL